MATLKIVPFNSVEVALAEQREALHEQRNFNTTFHTREEVEGTLPELKHFSPEDQPWILISPWLNLIASARALQETRIHRIVSPGTFLVQLVLASKVGLQMGKLLKDDAEDIADAFSRATSRGDKLEELIRTNKFHVRLDTCSLKDALIGEGHVKSTKDLWTHLGTSARGMAGIKDLRSQNPSTPVSLYLFP